MTRILITGVKEPAGGIENVVLSYLRHFDSAAIVADFAVFGETLSFEEEITARGGDVFYLPDRVRRRQEYLAAVRRIFEHRAYDAVWCNFSGLTNIDFLKAAKKAGVPKRVAHAHTAAYSWGNRLMKYLVPVFHHKNRLVVENYTTELWACSRKAAVFMYGEKRADRAKRICNAVDTARFAPDAGLRAAVRAEFGLAENAPVIGHVGRMCTAKNQLFLLDIMKEILAKRPDAKLLFIGDGELHDAVVRHAEELGIAPSLIFTGTRGDVPRLMQAFDLFLLPSVTEGLPVVLVEAQAADIPCVTSAGAVTDEVNVTGDVRFISLSQPAEEWAEQALAAAAAKPSGGREKLIAAGYDIAAEAKKMQDFFVGE